MRFEPVLALLACLGVLAGAVPFATEGSAVATLLAGLGVAGAIALVIQSVREVREVTPGFDAFAVAPFVFCVLLGVVSGLFAAHPSGVSVLVQVVYAAVGAAGGYALGIAAGLWAQRLGWIGGLVSVFALAASCGLILVAFVMLFYSA